MKLRALLRRAWPWPSKQREANPAHTDPAWLRASLRSPDDAQSVLSDPYQNHATVNAGLRLIAQGISQVPLKVYSGTDREPTEVADGPWYELLLKPNPAMNGNDFIEATIVYMAVSTDCFWVLEGRGEGFIGANETPTEMWPISGNAVQEVLSPDRRTLIGWRVNGIPDLYPPHAVVQHRWMFNPSNPWRGTSPLIAARAAIRMDSKANRLNEDLFDNGGIVGMSVTFPESQDLTKEQREEYRGQFDQAHVGWGKAFRTLVLSHGAKVETHTATVKDMAFPELKRLTKDEIANVLGVPTMFLGGDSAQAPYAGATAVRRIFYENTLIPLMRKIERACEAQLFAGRASPEQRGRAIAKGGRALWATFDILSIAALLQDMSDRLDQARKAQDMGVPLNVCLTRFEIGIAPVEGGDVPLIASGKIPMAMAAEGLGLPGLTGQGLPSATAETAEPEPEAPDDPEPPEPERAQRTSPKPDPELEAAANRAAKREAVLRSVQGKAMLPLQRRMETALRGTYQRMRQDALAAVGGERGVREGGGLDVDALIERLRAKFDKMLADRMKPLYAEGVRIAASTVEDQLGGLTKFDTQDPAVLDFLRTKELRLMGVNETVLDSLRKTLIEGMGATENLRDLQERVRTVMNTTSARALNVARTEASQVTNGARDLAMRAEGVTRTEWITARDGHVRDTHEGLDGKVVPLGTSFVAGVRLTYPGDIDAPAEYVVACRCVSAPAA